MINLERGVEYKAEVITPEGRPAAYVSFEFYNHRALQSGEPFFFSSGQIQGRTDSQGRLRFLSLRSRWRA